MLLLAGAGLIALGGAGLLPGGIRFYSVLTGSMEPALPRGSLVLAKEPNEGFNPKSGDILTFQQPGSPDRLITHRLIGTAQVGPATFYKTKGDANNSPDPWQVSYGQIKAKEIFSIPILGNLVTLLNTKTGIALFVLVPVAILAFQDVYQINKAIFEWQQEKATT